LGHLKDLERELFFMQSQLTIIAVTASLLGSLAACGGDKPKVKEPAPTPEPTATSTGTTAAAPVESAPAAGDKKVAVGSPASEFSGDIINGGGKFTLSAANKGKIVIVDFWATYCEPCKKSFPKLQSLNVKYKSSVTIVGVSEDDPGSNIKTKIADYGKTHGAQFPLIHDVDKSIAKKWDPATMPTTFILDKQGVVKFVHKGYHDGEDAEIEKEIKSLM
jgi:cytochrome c biogenesis protein CcmG, thiol:disulfide interchange protein DsbE